jgi:deoxycytidylate deaminase
LTTETDTVIVGTSERRLREPQRKVLEVHEIEAVNTQVGLHAEEKVILEAKKLGLKGQKIGASRKICLDCQDLIENEGIKPETEFSNKKSKNRK